MGKKAISHSWRKVALECARAAGDKKAADIVILDIRGISTVADYFLICEGSSDRHIRAIADGMKQGLKQFGRRHLHLDGYEEGRWVVIDFIGVIAHIFSKEQRGYYSLETLWGDAGRVDMETGESCDE